MKLICTNKYVKKERKKITVTLCKDNLHPNKNSIYVQDTEVPMFSNDPLQYVTHDHWSILTESITRSKHNKAVVFCGTDRTDSKVTVDTVFMAPV